MSQYSTNPDQDSEQQESFFHRWNWKLARLVQSFLLIILAGWILWLLIPGIVATWSRQALGAVFLQVFLLAAYLLLFISFQIILIYFFLARTRIVWIRPSQARVRFQDYRGNWHVLAAAERMVTLLKGVRTIRQGGDDLLRGLLLAGPPGTGKRYLAQAMAAEAGVPIGYLSAASLSVSRIGLGQIKVAMLYRKARKMAREYGACILLIDEIDSIDNQASVSAAMRGAAISTGGQHSVLNELLLQIDPPLRPTNWWRKLYGFISLSSGGKHRPAVLTIATTRHPQALSEVFFQPGRFNRRIHIGLPDAESRKAMLEYYVGKLAHDSLPLERMVVDTAGYTPATIKQVLGEAVVYAHLERRRRITYVDFTRANKTHGGMPHQSGQADAPIAYSARRQRAYYQAGRIYMQTHLNISAALLDQLPGRSEQNEPLFSFSLHKGTFPNTTSETLLTVLQILLAGRATEEVLSGLRTTHAAEDLGQASYLAMLVIGSYGMHGQLFSYAARTLSDRLHMTPGDDVHEQAEKLLQAQYQQARVVIEHNRDAVTMLAEALILHNDYTPHTTRVLLAQIAKQYPFVNPARNDPATTGLFARRAPQQVSTLLSPPEQRFAEPEPGLPDILASEQASADEVSEQDNAASALTDANQAEYESQETQQDEHRQRDNDMNDTSAAQEP